MHVFFRWDTQVEDAAKALLAWHDLCKVMCDLDSDYSIVYEYEGHATKKKELVSHLFYTARDILTLEQSGDLNKLGLKPAVEVALNHLKHTESTNKRASKGGGKRAKKARKSSQSEPILEEEEEEEEEQGVDFSIWKPMLFERSSDFLVSLLKIKIGHFPKALSTGDWESLIVVSKLLHNINSSV